MSVHQSSHQLLDARVANVNLPKCAKLPHQLYASPCRRISYRRRASAACSISETAEEQRPSWQTLPIRHVLESQQFDKVNPHAHLKATLLSRVAVLLSLAQWHAIIYYCQAPRCELLLDPGSPSSLGLLKSLRTSSAVLAGRPRCHLQDSKRHGRHKAINS